MLPLPPEKDFTADGMPGDTRSWMERTIIRALNEFYRPLRALLNRGLSVQSNLNAQVIGPRRVVGTASWQTVEVPSALRGRCLFILAPRAVVLDSANQPSAEDPSAWAPPGWQERDGRLRIFSQVGPQAGVTYSVTWLAFGE